MNSDDALKTVAKGAGIVFIGMFFGNGIGYLYRLLVARLLGPFDYGLLSLGIAVFVVITPIAAMGLPDGVSRYVAFYRGKQDIARVKGTLSISYKILTVTGIIFSVLFYLFSEWIAVVVFNLPEIVNVFRIFSVGVLFSILTTNTVAAFRGFKKMKYSVYIDYFLKKGVTLAVALIAIFLGYGLLGVIFGYVSAFIISFLFGFYLLNKKLCPIFKKIPKAISTHKKLMSFSIPLMFALFLWSLLGHIDSLLLGFLSTPVELGIYNAAFPTATLLMIVLTSIELIFMPVTSELLAKKRFAELGTLFRVISKWIFFVSLPLFLLMALFSDMILEVLFGMQYVPGAMALSILAVGYFIACSLGPNNAILLSLEKTKLILVNNFFVLCIDIVLNWYLIPVYGIAGAAVATAVSIALLKLLNLAEVYYYTKIQPFRFVFLKSILSGALAISLIYVIAQIVNSRNLVVVFLLFFTFLALYLVFLVLLKSFEKEDIMIISTIEKKIGLDLKFLKKIFRKLI